MSDIVHAEYSKAIVTQDNSLLVENYNKEFNSHYGVTLCNLTKTVCLNPHQPAGENYLIFYPAHELEDSAHVVLTSQNPGGLDRLYIKSQPNYKSSVGGYFDKILIGIVGITGSLLALVCQQYLKDRQSRKVHRLHFRFHLLGIYNEIYRGLPIRERITHEKLLSEKYVGIGSIDEKIYYQVADICTQIEFTDDKNLEDERKELLEKLHHVVLLLV